MDMEIWHYFYVEINESTEMNYFQWMKYYVHDLSAFRPFLAFEAFVWMAECFRFLFSYNVNVNWIHFFIWKFAIRSSMNSIYSQFNSILKVQSTGQLCGFAFDRIHKPISKFKLCFRVAGAIVGWQHLSRIWTHDSKIWWRCGENIDAIAGQRSWMFGLCIPNESRTRRWTRIASWG